MSSFDMTPAGLNPHSLVVTPDEGKLYVAVEQPAPQGVVRIVELNETKGYPAHSIDGVNCPEGLAISPDGRKLYVASQCASGQDPVFVIDTKTDKVVKAIAGFAVGLDIVIAQEGRRLYVERGSFYQPDPSTGAIVTMPAKLSSVDTTNNHEKEKSEETQLLREALLLKAGSDPVTPGPFAVTPDGKYLLVAVGSSVRIVNTATDTISGRSIDLATPPAGIAVGTPKGKKSLECYIWLPQERRLHMTGLSGFLPE